MPGAGAVHPISGATRLIVPEQDLQPIYPPGPGHEHRAGERVLLQRRLHQSRQSVMALSDVHGSGRDQDAHPVRGHHRACTPSARTIPAIRVGHVSASSRITTAPTAIRTSRPAATPSASGAGLCASHAASGANPGGPSAAGKTSLASFARRRQSETRLARTPYRSATTRTVTPGSSVSATIRALRSSGHRRRHPAEPTAPPGRKTSSVSSTEKLHRRSTPATTSQRPMIRKRWGPARALMSFVKSGGDMDRRPLRSGRLEAIGA